MLSLLACGGVAAQTSPADTANLRQPRPVPGIDDPYRWSPPASPAAMIALRDEVVYAAGSDLWASDGTAAGTRLLATLCDPYCGSEIVALGHGEDLAFFAARTGGYDFTWERLARTDGSPAGTVQVTGTFAVGYYDFFCPPARVVGERLYFSRLARDDDRFCEVWSSDGTATGTAPIDPKVAVESDFVPLGDEVYFLGTGPAVRGLWRVSTETGRLELVRAFHASSDFSLSHLMAAGGRLFFFGPLASLWTSDGTASGTLRLTRFGSQALLADFGGRAWFVADDGHGEELWSSDGSVAGTRPATDFSDPHPFRASPLTADKLAWLGRTLVFPALYRNHVSLWSTSENRSGAQLLQGCRGGCPVVAPLPLAVLGTRAVLVGLRQGAPAELWVTDGSGPGTRRLKSARGFSGLTAAGGGALFLERNQGGLFVGATDGTPGGTAGRLAAADPARENLAPAVAALDGRLLFPALDPGGGALWAVRPGSTAAEEVFLPPPHTAQPGPYLTPMTLIGRAGGRALAFSCDTGLFSTDSRKSAHLVNKDDLYYGCDEIAAASAGDGAIVVMTQDSINLGYFSNVWGTDGSRAGTFPIVGPTTGDLINVTGPVALDDRAVFIAADGPHNQLWHSDGSSAGTGAELEIPPDTGWSGMAVIEPRSVCFFAGTPPQLWCGDGTARGTRTVGPALTDPRLQGIESGLAALAGQVYFCDYGTPASLFALDEHGITEIRLDELGIERCSGITAAAGRIWLSTQVAESKWLSVSDGTPAGTLRLAELPGSISGLTAIGGAVLFVVDRDDDRHELWRSDGTVSGTRPLLEIEVAPYPAAYHPVMAGGRLWFAGIDREHGAELWSTDGTAAGTRLETDLAPGPAWSTPQSLLSVGNKLYFLADDTERSGIWVLDLDQAPAR
jgi:ELWxxDGT repeat protein